MRRYGNSSVIRGGMALGSLNNIDTIRTLVVSGQLSVTQYILKEGERLDHVAGKFLGDSSLWWAIAAASGIGWGMQCPPGTVLNVPNRTQMEKL